MSEDGTEITFHLRPGVKFQTTDWFTPTREMNADDVVFTFMRQFDKEGPWYEYAPGIAWEYFNSTMASSLKEIVKVDDMTVKFVLNRPDATILATFPMDFASIVSKEYADQLEAAGTMEQLNVQPVGTGPFTFVDYQQDAVIRYAGQRRLVERQAADRRPDLRDHRRRRRAPAEAGGRASATSSPIRTRPTSRG